MAPSLSWWENQGGGNLRGLVISHPWSGSKELQREPQFAFSIYTVHDPCTKEWCSPQSGGLPASVTKSGQCPQGYPEHSLPDDYNVCQDDKISQSSQASFIHSVFTCVWYVLGVHMCVGTDAYACVLVCTCV